MSNLSDVTNVQLRDSFTHHIKRTIKLGLPLVGMQLALIAITTTDVLMVGRLGAVELGAVSLSGSVIHVGVFIGLGIANAVMSMASQGEGADDPQTVRRSTRMGLWATFILAGVLMPVLWFTEPGMLAVGQNAEVASISQDYMRFAQFSLFPALMLLVVRSYLSSVDHTQVLFWTTLLGIAINFVLNYMFIYGNWGAPALGVQGAGIATIGANMLMLISATLYGLWHPALQKYELFKNFFKPDFAILKEVIVIGVPISVTILSETGLFITCSFLMGLFGPIPLAAHAIALQAASISFMVPLGFSGAATVRVGQAIGRGDRNNVGLAGLAVFVLAAGFSFIAATLFFLFPEAIVAAFLENDGVDTKAVIQTAVPLLMVAAAFQLVDGIQAVGVAALRGLKDTRVPMFIALFSYWPIGLGTAILLGFWLDYGPLGVWIGLALGLGFASIFMAHRFYRREQLGLVK